MKEKSDTFSFFATWARLVMDQTRKPIGIAHSDNGGEFISHEFIHFLHEHGIQRHLTSPNSPAQNARVERRQRTVMNMARSMLFAAELPERLWPEAVNTSVYLLNRCPTVPIPNMTPFEAFYGSRPSISHLRMPRVHS